jgi:hypothetical protein
MTDQFKWIGFIGHDKYVFRFTFRPQTGWRIYLLSYPYSSVNRECSGIFHMLIDDYERPYICWDGYIRDPNEALSVARRWAQLYQRYVYTGESFDNN